MINRDQLYYDSFDAFNRLKLSANADNTRYTIGMEGAVHDGAPLIAWQTAVFIGDTRQIWVRGKLWTCSNGSEIEIDKIRYVGGRFVISPAAMVCSEVEYIGNSGETLPNYGSMNEAEQSPSVFKCYFRQEDEFGRTRNNEFVVGDFALCQTLTPTRGGSAAQPTYYWREVVGKGNDFIMLSNMAGRFDPNSSWPKADDEIVAFGSSSLLRQSAIMLSSYGDGAPCIVKYAYINEINQSDALTFDAYIKRFIITVDGFEEATGRAFYKSYGDFYFGAKPEDANQTYVNYSQDEGLSIKAREIILQTQKGDKSIESLIADIKSQTDQSFTIWIKDDETTMSGLKSEWVEEDSEAEHEQDIFYDREEGKSYRFVFDDNSGEYKWESITDQDTLRSLELIKEKKRVFVLAAGQTLPLPPYDKGDLWQGANWGEKPTIQEDGTYPDTTYYSNELLVCVVARAKGETPSINDWEPATSVTRADLELLGDRFDLYVTKNDEQIVELAGKIEDGTASFTALVSTSKNEINGLINTATNTLTSLNEWSSETGTGGSFKSDVTKTLTDAQGIVTDAATTLSGLETWASDGGAGAELKSSVEKTVSDASETLASLSTWASEDGAGYKLVARAETAANNASTNGKSAAEEYVKSDEAIAKITGYTKNVDGVNKSFIEMIADDITLNGKVNFNSLVDAKEGDFYIDNKQLVVGYNYSSSVRYDTNSVLDKSGLKIESKTEGYKETTFYKGVLRDTGLEFYNKEGGSTSIDINGISGYISSTGIITDYIKLGDYNIKIVTESWYNSNSHRTDTIYIVI